LGRQLYPDLDLWQTAKPFLERWMDERVGVRAFFKGIQANAPFLAEKLPDLPLLLHDALLQQQIESAQLKRLNRELLNLRLDLQNQHRHSSWILSGGLLLLCASIISSLNVELSWNIPLSAVFLGSIGSFLLLMAWMRK